MSTWEFDTTTGAGSEVVTVVYEYENDGETFSKYLFGKDKNKIDGVKYHILHTKHITKNFSKFDLVFHLGEYSKVAPSFKEIELVFDLNIVGSFNVLEYCKLYNVPIVYAASSTKFASEGVNHSPYSFFKSTIAFLAAITSGSCSILADEATTLAKFGNVPVVVG